MAGRQTSFRINPLCCDCAGDTPGKIVGRTSSLWQRRHITDEPPADWLAQNTAPGARIGYDPLLFSEDAIQRFAEKSLTLVAVESNPVDAVWTDQPAAPMQPALPHALAHATDPQERRRAGFGDAVLGCHFAGHAAPEARCEYKIPGEIARQVC